MKKKLIIVWFCFIVIFLIGCNQNGNSKQEITRNSCKLKGGVFSSCISGNPTSCNFTGDDYLSSTECQQQAINKTIVLSIKCSCPEGKEQIGVIKDTIDGEVCCK